MGGQGQDRLTIGFANRGLPDFKVLITVPLVRIHDGQEPRSVEAFLHIGAVPGRPAFDVRL